MYRTAAVVFLIIALFIGSMPPISVADSVSGPGGTSGYYYDETAHTGLLNLSDGETWTLSITNLNVSEIAGNEILDIYLQDSSGYETLIPLQVQANFYGPGGHVLRSYDKGQVLKSSHSFGGSPITGNFDLRMLIIDLGANYGFTPQFRLPGYEWQTFSGGSWTSINYELTNVSLCVKLDSGADGTVTYSAPTAYSNNVWYVDSKCKIQDSVDAASPGCDVVVFGGTHLESLYINKSLVIRSAKTATIRGIGTHSSNYNGIPLSRKAVIFVVNSTNVVLIGLDIQGEGLSPGNNGGVIFIYSSGEIRECTISPNTVGDSSSKAVEARASNLNITECIVESFGRTGVYFGNSTGRLSDSTIRGQVYSAMDKVSYGVEVDLVDGVYHQGPSIVQLTANRIYNCDNTFLPEPLYPSCGVIVDYQRRIYEAAPSSVVLEGNSLHDNYAALELVSNAQSNAHYNDIFDNKRGITVDADYFGNNWTFNAKCNWWGDATGPSHLSNPEGIGDEISDHVKYSPWLNDTFEETPSLYHVNPTGTIQEAVSWAKLGDGILVHNGVYDEQVVINKTLTIQGSGASTIIRPSAASRLLNVFEAPWETTTKNVAPILAANVSDSGSVQVRFLKIDGNNIAALPSGADLVAGILYLETSGSVENVDVEGIVQTGSSYGTGIYVGSEINTILVEIGQSTVKAFRRNGIEVSAGTAPGKVSVNILDNTITGRGALGSGEPAQTGIRIADSAYGLVSGNRISNLQHLSGLVAVGILFADANGTTQDNSIDHAQLGLGVVVHRPGTWRVVFNNNTVSNSSLACLDVQVQNAASLVLLCASGNKFIQGIGEGVSIGLPQSQSPAGEVTLYLEDNVIDSWQNGIHLMSSVGNGSLIIDNKISANGYGILVEQAVEATHIDVNYNYIFGNTNYGIYSNASDILVAQSNWWGDPSGPTHPSNPEGTGDRVSDRVLFEPFLESIPERPLITVDPPFSIVAVDSVFDIRVNITAATGLYAWEFKLFYRNAILNTTASGVTEGSFLKSFGGTIFIKQVNNAYNSTHGCLLLACSLQGDASASGNGTLVIVTFRAKSRGATPLALVDTKLRDPSLPPLRIPHTAISGNAYADVLIKVSPAYVTGVAVGESFDVNVTVSGVANMYAWEFKLFYRNAILNTTASGVTEGSFLKSFGGTIFIKQVNNAYNSTHGRLLLACSLQGNTSASGSGVLVTIRFKARVGGITTLDLVDTKLRDPSLPPLAIGHMAIGGTVYIPGYYDVSVIAVVTSKTGCEPMPTVGVGYVMRANVTVENQGDLPATFNIALYVNSIPVATATVYNLQIGSRASCLLTWNTTGFSYGNYSITAKASVLPYEQDTVDNNLSGGWVLATLPGDVDGNFAVSIFDVVRITGCYGKKRGDLQYTPNADLDDSGVVNIFDVVICTGNYGKKCP